MSDRGDNGSRRHSDQVFVKHGLIDQPVAFFLGSELPSRKKEKLTEDITRNGGIIIEDPSDADTVLAEGEQYEKLAKRYDHSKTVWVEETTFVRTCLDRGEYSHELPRKRNLGGRTPYIPMVPYTAEDDYHLANYLAKCVPDNSGRKGLAIYRELCSQGNAEIYPWAERHPFQSWRNRYITNQAHLDEMIHHCLETHPGHPDRKSEYQYDEHVRIRQQSLDRTRMAEYSTREELSRTFESHRGESTPCGIQSDTIRIQSRRTFDVEEKDVQRQKLHSTAYKERSTGLDDYASSSLNDERQEVSTPTFSDIVFRRNNKMATCNSQATTQSTGSHLMPANSSAKMPTISDLSIPHRMAEWNRGRSATAKPGTTGKTVLDAFSINGHAQPVSASSQSLGRPYNHARNAVPSGARIPARSMMDDGKPVDTGLHTSYPTFQGGGNDTYSSGRATDSPQHRSSEFGQNPFPDIFSGSFSSKSRIDVTPTVQRTTVAKNDPTPQNARLGVTLSSWPHKGQFYTADPENARQRRYPSKSRREEVQVTAQAPLDQARRSSAMESMTHRRDDQSADVGFLYEGDLKLGSILEEGTDAGLCEDNGGNQTDEEETSSGDNTRSNFLSARANDIRSRLSANAVKHAPGLSPSPSSRRSLTVSSRMPNNLGETFPLPGTRSSAARYRRDRLKREASPTPTPSGRVGKWLKSLQ